MTDASSEESRIARSVVHKILGKPEIFNNYFPAQLGAPVSLQDFKVPNTSHSQHLFAREPATRTSFKEAFLIPIGAIIPGSSTNNILWAGDSIHLLVEGDSVEPVNFRVRVRVDNSQIEHSAPFSIGFLEGDETLGRITLSPQLSRESIRLLANPERSHLWSVAGGILFPR